MLGIIVNVGLWILGLFGFGKKDERDVERKAGVETGQLEAQNADQSQFIKVEENITDAQAKQRNDAGSVWNDPNNLDNPTNRH